VEEELMSLYEESILHSWQKKGVGTKHLEKIMIALFYTRHGHYHLKAICIIISLDLLC
jgi:hypothetical protein